MEKPRDDTPTRDLLDHGAATIAAIAADPETAGLEKPFQAANLALKVGVRGREDKDEEVLAKKAIFVVKDTALDRGINDFEARLLTLVNKKRDVPMYRRYFPNGLREITQAEPRLAEPAMVDAMLEALAEDEGKPAIGPLAVDVGPRLADALENVRLAEKDLAGVEAEADYLREMTIPDLRATWTDEWVKLHAAVVAALPRDPARAESFFAPFRKDRKKPAGAAGTPGAAAPGATDKAAPGAGSPATSTP